MDPSAQYAIIATREAWADAGSPEVDPTRLGAVVSSLVSRGLVLEFLHEHAFMLWKRWPFLVVAEDGTWRLPVEHEGRLPLMFSLRAARPSS